MSRGRHQQGMVVIFRENCRESALMKSGGEKRQNLAAGAFEGEMKMRGMLTGTTGALGLRQAPGIYASAGIVSGHASVLYPTLASCLTRQHQAL